jgi:hypothetical protein
LPGDNSSNGGNGGTGVYVSAFTGVVASTVGTTNDGWFAGGGGGAEVNGPAAGAGGRGGGGRSNNNLPGTAGSPNTGGGGGGGCWNGSSAHEGGAGGSGIVIVRYVSGGLDPFEAWRQTYFTAERLTNAAISSATADPDEDGLNNEQEYLAGTNPTNALSCLVISAATNNPATSGKFVLSWQSVSSKMYTLMAATNLMTGFTDLATNIQATPALWLASWLGSGVALGQSMVSSTLLKDQGVKEPTLRLFWTPPGGREEPVLAAAYTHRP